MRVSGWTILTMNTRRHTGFRPLLLGLVLLANVLISPHSQGDDNDAANALLLRSICPAGFTLEPADGCQLNSRYNQYASPHNSGVGGLRAGLPALRDGFQPKVIDLGRYLFFDPILSADKTIACSSCHDPQLGFADGLGRAQGINGAVLDRSAPSLWNIGGDFP